MFHLGLIILLHTLHIIIYIIVAYILYSDMFQYGSWIQGKQLIHWQGICTSNIHIKRSTVSLKLDLGYTQPPCLKGTHPMTNQRQTNFLFFFFFFFLLLFCFFYSNSFCYTLITMLPGKKGEYLFYFCSCKPDIIHKAREFHSPPPALRCYQCRILLLILQHCGKIITL